jgi:tRNA modification GTPase
LEEEVARRWSAAGQGPTLTRVRHRQALERCAASLRRVSAGQEGAGHEAMEYETQSETESETGVMEMELVAEDLRLAIRELGRITGRVDVEDILDVIFRDFCIGK